MRPGSGSRFGSTIQGLERAIASARSAEKLDENARRQLLEDEVVVRMLYIADGQSERALVPIDGVPAEEQEFWRDMLWAMANYFNDEQIPNEADRTGQVLVQLRSAVRKLQGRARLELRNVAFCSEIRSFGDYEPLKENVVKTRGAAIVYAEVENFRSVMTEAQFYTGLQPRVEFYREGAPSELVQAIDFPKTEDFSRNHRRDYFLAFDFYLPEELTPGRYTMVIQLDDQPKDGKKSGRMVTHAVKFEVVP